MKKCEYVRYSCLFFNKLIALEKLEFACIIKKTEIMPNEILKSCRMNFQNRAEYSCKNQAKKV